MFDGQEAGQRLRRESHSTWVVVVFGLLALLNFMPLRGSLRLGGGDGVVTSTQVIALTCSGAAFVAALFGVIGARRGWRGWALVPLGILPIGWLGFVGWMLANLPKC